jgi:hypothetical protein
MISWLVFKDNFKTLTILKLDPKAKWYIFLSSTLLILGIFSLEL